MFSMVYVMMALMGLHTAGWDSVALSGPQMKMINSTFWNDHVDGYLHTVLPKPVIDPDQSWLVCVCVRLPPPSLPLSLSDNL